MRNTYVIWAILLCSYFTCQGQISILKTNGNIGLGTINPQHQVDIFGDDLRVRTKSGHDRFRILSNGNIGIGTTSPWEKLDVNGDIRLRGSQTYAEFDVFDGGGDGEDGILDINIKPENSLSKAIVRFFRKTNTSQTVGLYILRGDNSYYANSLLSGNSDTYLNLYLGKVGIGTNSPTEKLHINGNIKAEALITPSDKRLKNILKSQIDIGLSETLLLNPVQFEYNGKGGTQKGGKHIGLIAQELQKVVPDFVQEYVYIKHEDRDSIGFRAVKEERFLEIRDSEIKYLLINAIKEQQSIIEDLENRIAELENNNSNIDEESIVLEISEADDIPVLLQNIPNPSDHQTTINYYLPDHYGSASLEFYSYSGQQITTVPIKDSGRGSLRVDISNLPNGNYTYSLIVDGQVIDTKTMGIIK